MPALLPSVTLVMVGALGLVAATKLDDAAEVALVPMLLVPVAVHV